MEYKNYIKLLGFVPKENAENIYIKKYILHNNYCIEVNFNTENINYGSLIQSNSKTTQNFSQSENFVVLECVDKLLIKGYKPQNIILEKVWRSGHGTSGRLDICVTRKDGSPYLLIECKTYGKEFDEELAKTYKDGGQLFTYFQLSGCKADIMMLYASDFKDRKIFRNEIIKIKDEYRNGEVKDIYNKWDKQFTQFGVWDNNPYESISKKITKKDLIELNENESKKIFNSFASILRKHSVSDKPNAFNKIFNLFLAKLYDEAKRDDDELEFYWREDDNPIDFQVRLINLHKHGLFAFLEKEIEGIQDSDFQYNTPEELQEKKKKMLKFNNVFAIKDVLDDMSFEENHRVLKEVVQLLEKYQIRYPRKQQHLSDFFELLLTTGLKQEVGQYFTPPPITKFVIRSLPIKEMITQKIDNEVPELPAVIDYAAGSGHFITEILEEYQNVINNFTEDEINGFYPEAVKQIKSWQADPYKWAAKYAYGIEKDYRLVKVAKVGCYFYGDGVAQIIHGDGLDSFSTSKTYKGLLKGNTNLEDSSKAKFSLVLSNPPYSVNDCKDDLEYLNAEGDFTLYSSLSEKSKDIECLFVERTKHLLKDGGLAGIILPNSILNNSGIQTKTREIILQYFDIIAITELGSNTFMATGTNTIVLFLRRRNNYERINLRKSVDLFFTSLIEVTLNGIENPVTKYVSYVWDKLSKEDYLTLLKKSPNKAVEESDLFKEYRKKIKAKNDKEFWEKVLDIEKEKLYYFILTYSQKVVVVKSGKKDAEKNFLGYEFSNRRGSEGIHAIERDKTIDECTQLFDAKQFENPDKVSTYIYKAFNGDFDSEIAESMQENVSRVRLVDMLNFDRANFEKTISTSVKKKVIFESKYPSASLENIAAIVKGVTYSKENQVRERTNNIVLTADNITLEGNFTVRKEIFLNPNFSADKNKLLKKNDCFICLSSGSKQHIGKVAFIENDTNYLAGGFMGIIRANEDIIIPRFLFEMFNSSQFRDAIRLESNGNNINNLSGSIGNLKIPLPTKEIQEKIVKEIQAIENLLLLTQSNIAVKKANIISLINAVSNSTTQKLENISVLLKRGKSAKYGNSDIQIIKSGQARGYKDFDFTQKYYISDNFILDERKLIKGDILINSTGVGTAGRVTLFNFDGNFVVDSHITILRLNQTLAKPLYVLYALAEGIGFKNIEAMAQGQSGQIELPISVIQNIQIPLPSINEQQRIVSEIETLEQEIAKAQQIIDNIPSQRTAILRKYL